MRVRSDGMSCVVASARLFLSILPNSTFGYHYYKFPSISFGILGILFFGIDWLVPVDGYLDLLSEFEDLCESGSYCIIRSSDRYLLSNDPFVNIVYFVISDSDFEFLSHLSTFSSGVIVHSSAVGNTSLWILSFSSFSFFWNFVYRGSSTGARKAN